jgi:RsiW-degrading membrane proteinase PrsW (M82 family)
VSEQGSEKRTKKGESGTFRVWIALVAPATAGTVIYAAAMHSWSILALSAVVSACAFSGGALLGFLFGIPQYFARSGPSADPAKASYQPNTNLTQVSDWLTKIIIGVGLVQFSQLTKSIGKLGDSLSSGFGGEPMGKPYAISVVVGYFLIGFLASYLYTRLRLQWAFAQADRGAFDELIDDRNKADEKALSLTDQQLDPSFQAPPPEELEEALANASAVAQSQALSKAHEASDEDRAQTVIEALKGQ